MRYLRSSAALCALLTLSVAAACVGTSDPLPSVVSVSLALNRTSLRTGDTLLIEVLGTNTAAEAIQVPNYPCLATLDIRNERDESVEFGDPIYCQLPLYAPKVLAPGDSWGDTVTITHPALGQFRVRGGLPLQVAGGYVYSDFTSVTVRP